MSSYWRTLVLAWTPLRRCVWVAMAAGAAVAHAGAQTNGVIKSGFLYEQAPFPSCHASTIAETPAGLFAAWFGGSDEGEKDVAIWTARYDGKSWSRPVEAAHGRVEGGPYPCWNPVLFQPPVGPLLLFYKVGPSPSTWWGMLITSEDHGTKWSKPKRLPAGILGPIKNKPVLVGETLLCPSSSEHEGWRIHLEKTSDFGQTWTRTGPLNDAASFGAIQPTILAWPTGVQMLCRSRQGAVTEVHAEGEGWSRMVKTALPNPSAGLDAVLLRDNRALLVYNHTPRGRSPLNVASSADGKVWEAALVLEDQPGEYSYPAVIQTRDGLVHTTYTWKREKIKHVVIDPAKLRPRSMAEGVWPAK